MSKVRRVVLRPAAPPPVDPSLWEALAATFDAKTRLEADDRAGWIEITDDAVTIHGVLGGSRTIDRSRPERAVKAETFLRAA